MPTDFDSMFASDAAPGLLSLFGEKDSDGEGEGVYIRAAGGEPRVVDVIVNRDGYEQLEDGTRVQVVTATVLNSTTRGITHDEVQVGKDKIKIREHVGGPLESRTIGTILSSTGGMLEFKVF